MKQIKLNQTIKTLKDLSTSLHISQNKLMDYLRHKGILDYYNQPEKGFEDWFEKILHHDYSTRRLDLTPKGVKRIQEEINKDGLDKVTNRKTNGKNRKGDKHGQTGFVPSRK